MKGNVGRSVVSVLAILLIMLIGCGEREPEATLPATSAAPEQVVTPEETSTTTAELEVPSEASPTAAQAEAVATTVPQATATRRSILSSDEDANELSAASVLDLPADDTGSAPESTMGEAASEEATMSLSAEAAVVEHSVRPEDFQIPGSLDEIGAADESSWQVINPGEAVAFKTYDGVRVTEEGEALIDLGDLMHLLLKRDTILQSVSPEMAAEELSRIRVEIAEDTPALQRLALGLHLLRGGFLGQKSVGSDPIVLTTPNAIIVVEGTSFFVVYDPESGITWVANFDGTMSGAERQSGEEVAFPPGQLVAIPAIDGRQSWPLHDHLTPAEFETLIDQLGSPVAAAEMISGPYLYGVFSPDLAVRNGPGSEFAYVGTLESGEYVRVIGQGRTWWQIECPQNTNSPGSDCWVSGGNQYTRAFNTANVPVTAKAATQTPTSMPSATPTKSATPQLTVTAVSPTPEVTKPAGTAPGDVFDCKYLGNGKFEWYTDEGGPFTGTWQSGCPAAPSISFDGCAVTWSAGSNNVVSASISLKKVGTVYGEAYDQTDEFGAALPDGTQGFSLPAGFIGKVTASLNSQLDSGNSDSTSATHSFDSQCSS